MSGRFPGDGMDGLLADRDDTFGFPQLPSEMLPDAGLFRGAMSRIAAAVHIATAADEEGPAGLTVTSFVPVSDGPPTVLLCVKSTSRALPTFERSGYFNVNTLGAGHQGVADLFAGRVGISGAARFSHGDAQWIMRPGEPPLLADALAVTSCRLIEMRTVATHCILIARVVALKTDPGERPALVYKNRAYHGL